MDNTSFITNKQKYTNILQKAAASVNGKNPPIGETEIFFAGQAP
ncbi:MAG: hypothetical protein SOV63_02885 [Pyramidobacter porci]|nr:hypothetical protein [Pyramidobacter porci]